MEENRITEDFLRSIDVHGILPQQEPFVMIDTLTHFDMSSSSTETTLREDNIFVEEGRFSAAGMLENMAQTCAARIGFYNKYILHKDVQVGVIGAVRDYNVIKLPSVGSVLSTRVDIIEDIFGMTLADASISCQDDVIATARIKLAVRTDGE